MASMTTESSPATKHDFFLVSVVGLLIAVFLVPILENLQLSFWQTSFKNIGFFIVGAVVLANICLFVGYVLRKTIPAIWQFMKYSAVGSMTGVVGIGLLNFFSLMTGVYSGYLIAIFNTIAFTVAVINSYFWHKLWSFQHQSPTGVSELSKFIGVSIISILISNFFVYTITTFFSPPEMFSEALWENIAALIAVPPILIWSFYAYRTFVFTKRSLPDSV